MSLSLCLKTQLRTSAITAFSACEISSIDHIRGQDLAFFFFCLFFPDFFPLAYFTWYREKYFTEQQTLQYTNIQDIAKYIHIKHTTLILRIVVLIRRIGVTFVQLTLLYVQYVA